MRHTLHNFKQPLQTIESNSNLEKAVLYANQYIDFLNQKGLSFHTIRLQSYGLKKLLTYLSDKNYDVHNLSSNIGQDYFLWLKTKGLSISSIYKYLQITESFLKYINLSSDVHDLSSNTLMYVKVNNSLRFNNRPKLLPFEKVITLIESCTTINEALLIFLLYETGMRISEALSIHLDDIDIALGSISIRDRGLLENGASIKTSSSIRTIYCSSQLMNIVSNYIVTYSGIGEKNKFLFVKTRGAHKFDPMAYSDVDNLFRRLRKKTGIYVTPHMLRHSSISFLYAAGWPINIIANRAGHSRPSTTAIHYIHYSLEELIDAFANYQKSTTTLQ